MLLFAAVRFAEVEFVTDVMTLASALAEQPQVMVEIWHKERSVPLGAAA